MSVGDVPPRDLTLGQKNSLRPRTCLGISGYVFGLTRSSVEVSFHHGRLAKSLQTLVIFI